MTNDDDRPDWLANLSAAEWADVARCAAYFRKIGIDNETRLLTIVVRHDDPAGHIHVKDPLRVVVGPGNTLSAELAICEATGLLRFCLFEGGWALFSAGPKLPPELAETPEKIFDNFVPAERVEEESRTLN